MVAELSKEPEVSVEKVDVGPGEFSVWVDGQRVAGARLVLIPNVEKTLKQVRAALNP